MSKTNTVPIVGVGASAGGVEALQGLFASIPSNPGVGIVIVTHMNPARESFLQEIVSRYTDLDVQSASDGAEVQANCVYVLRADTILAIENGRLKVIKRDSGKRERMPIDVFFSTLARDRGEYAASIVLSGADGDGTLGTKAIKERGGLTMAQIADGQAQVIPACRTAQSQPDLLILQSLLRRWDRKSWNLRKV